MLASFFSVSTSYADDTVTTRLAATPPPISTVQPPSDPVILPLRPGNVVPWPGLLLNPAAVAQIKVDLDNAKGQCEIVTQRAVAEQKAHDDYDKAVAKAESDRQKAVLEANLRSRTSELNDLTKRLEAAEKDKPNTYLWAGLGFGAGIAVTVLTVFAVNQASK